MYTKDRRKSEKAKDRESERDYDCKAEGLQPHYLILLPPSHRIRQPLLHPPLSLSFSLSIVTTLLPGRLSTSLHPRFHLFPVYFYFFFPTAVNPNDPANIDNAHPQRIPLTFLSPSSCFFFLFTLPTDQLDLSNNEL